MLALWLPLIDNLNNQGLDDAVITNSGATINTSGKIGNCYSFNGSNSFISVDDSNLYNIIQGGDKPFTIMFWIYHADSTRGIIFGDWGLSGSVNFNIELTASHQIRFFWNGGPDKIFTDTTAEINTWVHIVLAYDGSKICIYKNGSLQTDTYASSLIKLTKTSGLFYLGRDSRTRATTLNGRINDFRIYDTALSPREIKEISSALVLHYPLSREGFGADNIIPNTWLEERTFEYPTSSYRDCFSPITTIVPTASQYTLSFWAKSTVSGDQIRTHFYSPNTTTTCVSSQGITKTAADGNMDFTLSTEWEYYWVTYSQSGTTAVKHVICPRTVSGYGTGTVSIKCIKLEEGETPTPWIPNSADNLYTAMGLDNGIVYDTSGFGYNGTKTGVTYSSDSPRYSTSTKFDDNTNDVTPMPCFSNGQTVDEMSISIWFKTNTAWSVLIDENETDLSDESGNILVDGIGMDNTENNADPNFFSLGENEFVRARIATSTSIWSYSKIGTGSPTQVYFDCENILDNEWHHFVYVFNKGIITCYIDGEVLGSEDKSYVANYLYCGSQSWHLAGYTATSEKFIGSLSDFRLYATALSADGIADLYHVGASLSNNGVLMAYEFIE